MFVNYSSNWLITCKSCLNSLSMLLKLSFFSFFECFQEIAKYAPHKLRLFCAFTQEKSQPLSLILKWKSHKRNGLLDARQNIAQNCVSTQVYLSTNVDGRVSVYPLILLLMNNSMILPDDSYWWHSETSQSVS